jgi:DNA-binding HxlR family transcriptional regulator
MLQMSGSDARRPTAETTMNASGLSVRTWNDAPISRRDSDGYADATTMCQANGKRWHNYERLDTSAAYLQALAASLGIPADQLVITTTTGPNHLRGTWVHPRLAVDLARWLSPQFAVWMDGWFLEQVGQPQLAPTLMGDGWRSMDADQWLSQPKALLAAQYLLLDAEAGGSHAIDLFRRRCERRPEALTPGAPGHRIRSLLDLPPSGRAAVLTVRRLRTSGGPARTSDVRRELSSRFSPDTIANRLRKLRQEGFITKRGTGWHLTQIATDLADHLEQNQALSAAA